MEEILFRTPQEPKSEKCHDIAGSAREKVHTENAERNLYDRKKY